MFLGQEQSTLVSQKVIFWPLVKGWVMGLVQLWF